MKTGENRGKNSLLLKEKFLDPRGKIILVLSLLVIMFYTKNVYIHVTLFVISFLLLIMIQLKLKYFLVTLTFLSVFAILATLFAHWISITSQPFHLFITIESRFVNSFAIITWLFSTVTPYELTTVLEKMYIPPKVAWLLTSIYQLIPVTTKEVQKINDIRKTKGIVAKKWNIKQQYHVLNKVIKPIIAGSVNRGIDIAETMILKGFRPDVRRTHILKMKFRIKEIVISSLAIGLCVLVIIFT